MAKSKRPFEPQTTFCFQVKLTNLPGYANGEGYFKSVSGLKYETEVVDYKQGGENLTTRKLVGATKWGPIVLKKGFCGDGSDLLAWKRAWMDEGKTSLWHKRSDGVIVQLNSAMKPVCSWTFRDAWPSKWELSEYDATKAEIAIETLELQHEGLVFSPGS